MLAEYCSSAELLLNVLDPVVTQDKVRALTFIVGKKSYYLESFTKFTELIILYIYITKLIRNLESQSITHSQVRSQKCSTLNSKMLMLNSP